MMADIININDFRKPEPKQSTWVGDLSFFLDEDGSPFAIVRDFNDDMGDDVPDRFRALSRILFHTGWLSMKMANEERPDDDGDLLAMTFIFESSLVRLQVDDEKFVTSDQKVWLDERFDDAKRLIER